MMLSIVIREQTYCDTQILTYIFTNELLLDKQITVEEFAL